MSKLYHIGDLRVKAGAPVNMQERLMLQAKMKGWVTERTSDDTVRIRINKPLSPVEKVTIIDQLTEQER